MKIAILYSIPQNTHLPACVCIYNEDMSHVTSFFFFISYALSSLSLSFILNSHQFYTEAFLLFVTYLFFIAIGILFKVNRTSLESSRIRRGREQKKKTNNKFKYKKTHLTHLRRTHTHIHIFFHFHLTISTATTKYIIYIHTIYMFFDKQNCF